MKRAIKGMANIFRVHLSAASEDNDLLTYGLIPWEMLPLKSNDVITDAF